MKTKQLEVGGGGTNWTHLFSLLYGTPANSAESQQPEAWPANIYGHLREGYLSVPCELTKSASW